MEFDNLGIEIEGWEVETTQLMFYIAILAMFYAIYKAIAMIIKQYTHLDDETIADYLHGRIKKNTAESRKVTAHLGICEKCRNKMVEQD